MNWNSLADIATAAGVLIATGTAVVYRLVSSWCPPENPHFSDFDPMQPICVGNFFLGTTKFVKI